LQKKWEYYQKNWGYFKNYREQHRMQRILNQKNYMARYQVAHREEYRKKMREYARAYRRRRKYLVLSCYSLGQPACATCGEGRIACLTIDHINGGGRRHRQSVGEGTPFYNWLRDNNYPDGYQVLCMNCQWVKYFS